MTPRIQPITRSISALRTQIADAEWNNDAATALVLSIRLASLLAAKARGEQWDVPF